jgi:hypothetical protein
VSDVKPWAAPLDSETFLKILAERNDQQPKRAKKEKKEKKLAKRLKIPKPQHQSI